MKLVLFKQKIILSYDVYHKILNYIISRGVRRPVVCGSATRASGHTLPGTTGAGSFLEALHLWGWTGLFAWRS